MARCRSVACCQTVLLRQPTVSDIVAGVLACFCGAGLLFVALTVVFLLLVS
jgi:hypothetical protein